MPDIYHRAVVVSDPHTQTQDKYDLQNLVFTQ